MNNLPWLANICDSLRRNRQADRLGHAMLLSGPGGIGKRALARWLATLYLTGREDGESGPAWPVPPIGHPDGVWIRPEEGKRRISVDQIRELVADIGLTSHAGGGKAAVIEPANAMTLNAANSLLKTLEEPPGDALIVLVADTLSAMPPTVLSRCAVLRVPLPPPAAALDWLGGLGEDADWREALALAGGAPLRAVDLVRDGTAELPGRFREDLAQVLAGRLGPLEAAGRWAKPDPVFAIGWLEGLVRDLVRRRIGGAGQATTSLVPESVLQHMDTRNLFCYLDRLTRLRNQPGGSYNELLALESLLIPWADGFRGGGDGLETAPLGSVPTSGGMRPQG